MSAIAELTVDCGPDGRLGGRARRVLMDEMSAVRASGAAQALLLTIRPGARSVQDETVQDETVQDETVQDETGPIGLGDLCTMLESTDKPVIAALSGGICGEALDLALAAHYRVGAAGLRVAMSGIRTGLPPSGGATQRLPRLLGAGPALAMLLDGRAIAPPEGFLDIADAPDAMEAARALAAERLPPRPTAARREGLGDAAGFMAEVARARGAHADSHLAAPARILGCVEAALLLPFEAGLEMERAAHDDCARTPAARALAWITASEAAAAPLVTAPAGPLERIAILGGTTGAGDLALACLDAGLDVTLVALDAAGQAVALERVLDLYDAAVASGSLSARDRDARLLRITPDGTLDDLPGVDAIWETGDGAGALKDDLWHAVGLLARPGALLLAAGNVLRLSDLARAAGRGADCATLHPGAPGSGLAELAVLDDTAPETVAGAVALAQHLGRAVVAAPDRPGLIAHPLALALHRAIERLLLGGLRAEVIDRALLGFGFAHAPCAALDFRGLDHVLAHRRALVAAGCAPGGADLSVLDVLVDSGLTGCAAGAGLLTWDGDNPGAEPDETRALLDALAEADGIVPLALSDSDIATACAAAMADAGARLIEAGQGVDAAHVDVAAVHGLGFPRWKGGPMMAADLHGLVQVEQVLGLLGLSPAASFDENIKAGRGFHTQG